MTVFIPKARKSKPRTGAQVAGRVAGAGKNKAAATKAPGKVARMAEQAAQPAVMRVADVQGDYVVKPASRRRDNGTTGRSMGRSATREPTTMFDRMSRLLDQPLRSESDVVRMVDAGLPAAAFTQLTTALNIGPELIASESTIRRRVQENQRFTTDESERMVRIARVHALAAELFGDDAAARAWLNAPAAYVHGAAAVTPYKLSVTDAGARLVEDMLLRTAHGVF
jgi:putative toxin-antitoxin system antitoxin component (TIGR02293 family)